MTYISFNLGNVLYVSKQGNNLGAEKGRIDRPWRDPWAAVAAAVAGDVIRVMPGTYTMGDVGSGADYEVNLPDTGYSLWKNNISWYFEKGAKIVNASTDGVPIFYFENVSTPLHVTFSVKGEGEFQITGLSSYLMADFYDNGNTYELSFEAYKIDNQQTGSFYLGEGLMAANIKVDYVSQTGLSEFLVIQGPSSAIGPTPIQESKVDVTINRAYVSYESGSLSRRSLFKITSCESLVFDAKIGSFFGRSKGPGVLLGIGGSLRPVRASAISVDVGALVFKDYGVVNSDYASFALTQDATGLSRTTSGSPTDTELNGLVYMEVSNITDGWLNFENNVVNVSVGSLHGDISAGVFVNLADEDAAPAKFVRNNLITLDVYSAFSTNNHPAIVFTSLGAGTNSPVAGRVKTVINVVEAISETGPVVWLGPDNKIGQLIIKGTLRTLESSMQTVLYGDSTPVQALAFHDTVFLNDGSTEIIAPVTGSIAQTILLKGDNLSNGGSENVNVTLQVGTITTNAAIF